MTCGVLLCFGATASATAATRGTRASTEPAATTRYALRWDAPDECPSLTELRRRLDALSVRDGPDAPLRIDAEVRPSNGKFQLRLRLSDEPARRFDADNCSLLAETLVVLSAVALGSSPVPAPTTVTDSPRPSQPQRTPNERSRAARVAASTSTGPMQPRAVSRLSTSSMRLEASLGTTSALGSKRALGSALLGLGVAHRFSALLAGLRASVASTRIAEGDRAGTSSGTSLPTVRLSRWTVSAALCGGGSLGSAPSAWEAWVCAELGPSLWSAAAEGLTSSTPQRSVLWSVGAAVRGGRHLSEHWRIVGSGQLERPFPRLDWAVRDPTTNATVILHQTPALGVSWALGMAYSF